MTEEADKMIEDALTFGMRSLAFSVVKNGAEGAMEGSPAFAGGKRVLCMASTLASVRRRSTER